MRICALASGSKGNSIYVESSGTSIIIDNGLSLKDLKSRADICGIDLNKIKAILVTHEHIDHIKGVGILSRATNAVVYAPPLCYDKFKSKLGNFNYAGNNDNYESGFDIENIKVSAFRTPHDSSYSVGYKLESEGKTCVIATDLGVVTQGILDNLLGADMAVLESNHDVEMLKNGSYPIELKKRILSSKGHLSNDMTARTIGRLVESGTKKILLAHLSEDNNRPEIAYAQSYKVIENLGAAGDVNLDIAWQYKPSKITEIR